MYTVCEPFSLYIQKKADLIARVYSVYNTSTIFVNLTDWLYFYKICFHTRNTMYYLWLWLQAFYTPNASIHVYVVKLIVILPIRQCKMIRLKLKTSFNCWSVSYFFVKYSIIYNKIVVVENCTPWQWFTRGIRETDNQKHQMFVPCQCFAVKMVLEWKQIGDFFPGYRLLVTPLVNRDCWDDGF